MCNGSARTEGGAMTIHDGASVVDVNARVYPHTTWKVTNRSYHVPRVVSHFPM